MNITDICNVALGYLGKSVIASVDEESEPARQCKRMYPITKKSLLRNYDWGFAKKVVALAQLTATHPKWEYVYSYPNKCIRAMKLYSVEDGEAVVDTELEPDAFEIFMVNDNTIALGCDIENAYLEYIYDADDAGVFPSDFTEALCHLLASNMALQLTGSSELKSMEYQLAQACLNEARTRSAMERQREPEYPSKYYDARS